MSLKTNYEYIKEWVNSKFLKKSDLSEYYTKDEIDSEVKINTNDYLSKKEYEVEEDIIASALVDLDGRLTKMSKKAESSIGTEEEFVIATALNYLNNKVNSAVEAESPNFTGIPTAPTAASGTNTTQIATTEFVTTAVSEGVPILGVSLNGSSGTLSNHIANVTLTKSNTGTGNIVTDVSIEGNVITVNKSNLPFKANSGTTRPTLTNSDVGYIFLDLSLGTSGKPIWWTGSNWIDATGANV